MSRLQLTILRSAFTCCAVAILYLALDPAPQIAVSTWDKLNHVTAFAVLQVLGMLSWERRPITLLGGLAAYGVLIEVLQNFTPPREATVSDVLADVVGLAVGWALVKAYRLLAARRMR